MSATQKNILAVALMLAAVMGSVSPAAAQVLPAAVQPRGIWVIVDRGVVFAPVPWTLTVINLTDNPLSLVANSVRVTAPRINWTPTQYPPFWGDVIQIEPNRNVTWMSNEGLSFADSAWNGALTFQPIGMGTQWQVTLNLAKYTFPSLGVIPNRATWVYLTADFTANPDWQDVAPYNISCSYPDWYNKVYNVMTLSGTDLAVSLYAPYIDEVPPEPTRVTLVFKQRRPHTPLNNGGYEDSLLMPCLRYQDNNMPDTF